MKKYPIDMYSTLKWNEENAQMANETADLINEIFNKAYDNIIDFFDSYNKGNIDNNSIIPLCIGICFDKLDSKPHEASYIPEKNQVRIYKYCKPYTNNSIVNILDNPKFVESILTHELLHYSFTTFSYETINDEQRLKNYQVGLRKEILSSQELSAKEYAELDRYRWLDEILTELLAVVISGTNHISGIYLEYYQQLVKKEDMQIFYSLIHHIENGVIDNTFLKTCIDSLSSHNPQIIIDTITKPICVELAQQ